MEEKSILLVGKPMGLFIAKSEGAFEDVDEHAVATCGAELNVAIGLTRLGHRVSHLTKLGPDPFGRRIVKQMRSEGIATDDILYDDTLRTGLMLKGSTSVGDPAIHYFRAGSAASTLCPDDMAGLDFSKFSAIHMTGIRPRFRKARARSAATSHGVPTRKASSCPSTPTCVRSCGQAAR